MNAPLVLSKPIFRLPVLLTWAIVLLVSDLPNAIWQAITGAPPAWVFWVKVVLLLALIITSLTWKPLRVVRPYLILLFVLMLALWSMNWLWGIPSIQQWEHRIGWVTAMAGFQLLKLTVALLMITALLLMRKHWKDFFFARGDLRATVIPTRNNNNPHRFRLTWGGLGLILGVCIAPLTFLFFGLGNLPSSENLIRALPYFPAALLFAATNSFSEEVQYRGSLLGDLQNAVGPDHAIWLTATFFGFSHYFGGSPAGIPGVLIAGLLGALFARCMLGSKSVVVPWFIHFCQNAVIFAFMAIGAVA